MTDVLAGTPHFTLAEVQRNTQWPIPAEYHANAQRTLEFLEEVRAVVGVPLVLTSLWRSPEYNSSLPGHATASQHLTADGADVKPQGITLEEASARFLQGVRDGRISSFRQFIAETNGKDGLGEHIHVGTGAGNQTLARDAEGVYHQLTDWLNAAVSAVDDALETVFSAGNGAGGVGAVGVALIGGFRRVVTLLTTSQSLRGSYAS